MPLTPITPVEATTATGYLSAAESSVAPSSASPTGASDFAQVLGSAVDGTQQLQGTANELAIAAVTGDLKNVHEATLAATRAQTTLELVATVRNKAVDAFNEIMRMQA
ncbi:flagellar hook-basal body complex protein FliE [Isoptericola sp. NEAU-Y5]|uniref:Flagellar hook-basal body complex protein FliE n=1 Tax=Isoptericola luteus TaxID=2879484 RepID=A0ABS7ZJD4_9MICO|nr:flagellar hook-basal body complex protein FliE [Isoptericola sp. NEAU-Y5]MCA5895136.1 flagellar hook-basal body complex protein FliE [Isoptericola sp. NEAU-Y5]